MTISQLIGKNLWALMSAGLALLLSYTIGSTNTANAIQNLKDRMTSIERRADRGEAYHACATRHFDRLESGSKGPNPCELGER